MATPSRILALAITLSTAPAAAQGLAPSAPPAQEPLAPPSHMWIDLGFYYRDSYRVFGQKGFWIAPDIGLDLRVGDAWTLELVAPLSAGEQRYASTRSDGSPSSSTGAVAAVGNVTASLSRWSRLGDGTLQLGGLVALPSSIIMDEGFAQLAGAGALRGLWNPWRYSPDTFAGIVHARYRWDSERFSLTAEGAFGVLVGVGDLRDDAAFALQVAIVPMLRLGERSGLGARLQGVYLGDDDGLFQASAVPFVRFAPGRSDLDIWFNLNLDEPYGWSFDKGVWGLGARLTFPL
jgi:hypothetical protein